MRILVTGAAGTLGRAVMSVGTSHDLLGVDLVDGDLTSANAVDHLFARHDPDWVVHCAAYTDVDGAESDRETARRVNGEATTNLIKCCDRDDVGLTFVSTDYVFAGKNPDGYGERDLRDPVNHYGSTKAAAEQAVEAMTAPGQIVRTSWLFGPGSSNFVLTIRRLLGSRPSIRVVDDQRGCPTYAPDLAGVLLFLAENGTPGHFHGTNSGACSWFEFARAVALADGWPSDVIQPCSSQEYPTPARRPACSILRSETLEALGCAPRPTWEDALDRYLNLLRVEESR